MNILVTGGSRGIGLACARKLALDGHRIALASRSQERLQSALKSLNGEGHLVSSSDLTQSQGIDRLFSNLDKIFSPEIVVHALGGMPDKPSDPDSVESWRAIFDLNLFSIIALNKRLLPIMQKQGKGRIIHISSSAAAHGKAHPSYASAKAALNRYISSEGRKQAPQNIELLGIMPAAVDGDDSYWERLQQSDPSKFENARKNQALGRFQKTSEIADAVAFLTEPSATIFSGCVLPADALI